MGLKSSGGVTLTAAGHALLGRANQAANGLKVAGAGNRGAGFANHHCRKAHGLGKSILNPLQNRQINDVSKVKRLDRFISVISSKPLIKPKKQPLSRTAPFLQRLNRYRREAGFQ
jgi:hypothetical protein